MKPQAKESRRIEKLREKLEKTLNSEKQKFTKETLALILDKIHTSIERHQQPLSKRKFKIKKD
jgi:hypothetical protein